MCLCDLIRDCWIRSEFIVVCFVHARSVVFLLGDLLFIAVFHGLCVLLMLLFLLFSL